MTKVVAGKADSAGRKLGSDEFCRNGLAAACMADYPEHSALKSP